MPNAINLPAVNIRAVNIRAGTDVDHVRPRLRTIEHRSHGGAWRMDFLRPPAGLAAQVQQFNAYTEHDTEFTRRREMPNGLATILFNLGHDLRIEHPAATHTTFTSGSAFFTGPSTTYAVSETDRAQQGVQVILTPLGARRLLGMPLIEVGDRLLDPVDLLGRSMRETLDQLQAATTHEQRLAILEPAIMHRLASATDEPAADITWALGQLRATQGRVQVSRLAESIGCSRKHLTVRFTRAFGMPPKVMGRVLRFDHALQRVRVGRFTSWADLAASCGYADQAHLGREFLALAGDWPSALLRRTLPDDGGFTA